MGLAQGLGQPDERRFWLWAIPTYFVSGYVLWKIGRLLEQEIWYWRLVWSHRASISPAS